ncbi:MAG: hypothetical protein VX899_12410 [Myxococcota bacterium]|nr:hypothetical protein [Myxococcota bacterium]
MVPTAPNAYSAQNDTLSLAALAWRERWTGTLEIQVGESTRSVCFRNGGPVKPSDFTLLNAYALRDAEFRFVESAGPKGLHESLGQLLLRLASKKALELSGGRVQLGINAGDAELLELPEPLLTLSCRPGARPQVSDLAEDLEAPELLGALLRLGFLTHHKEQEVTPFADPSVGNLLSGMVDLNAVLGDLEIPLDEAIEFDPVDDLLDRVRGLADLGRWEEADGHLRNYVGSVDRSELAAWRGWVRLNCGSVPVQERVQGALKWARLSEKLPFDPEAQLLGLRIRHEADRLLRSQEGECA